MYIVCVLYHTHSLCVWNYLYVLCNFLFCLYLLMGSFIYCGRVGRFVYSAYQKSPYFTPGWLHPFENSLLSRTFRGNGVVLVNQISNERMWHPKQVLYNIGLFFTFCVYCGNTWEPFFSKDSPFLLWNETWVKPGWHLDRFSCPGWIFGLPKFFLYFPLFYERLIK